MFNGKTTNIQLLNQRFAACSCGNTHHPVEMVVDVSGGALANVTPYIRQVGWQNITVATDIHTHEAAGDTLIDDLIAAGLSVVNCIFKQDERGDVLADSSAVMQLLLHMNASTDVLIACGSGTIHDIVRFVAAKTNRPFISVPTAASVDGFTSAGAPLIIDGVKTTIQSAAPKAVFADLNILSAAPQALTAAGFGDMLGKYSSLADWQVSARIAHEPFCQTAYEITRAALDNCVSSVEAIARGSKEGIKRLIEALIDSGLSMLAVDHSRPASGGEHHISHIWEMQGIERRAKQLLHGAKVGVATVLISRLYKKLAETGGQNGAFEVYHSIPSSESLADLLQMVGGPVEPHELHIESERIRQALWDGPNLRDRATGLRYIRDHYPHWLNEIVIPK